MYGPLVQKLSLIRIKSDLCSHIRHPDHHAGVEDDNISWNHVYQEPHHIVDSNIRYPNLMRSNPKSIDVTKFSFVPCKPIIGPKECCVSDSCQDLKYISFLKKTQSFHSQKKTLGSKNQKMSEKIKIYKKKYVFFSRRLRKYFLAFPLSAVVNSF